MDCCRECPKRYLVVFLGFIGLLVSIGFRTCFTLVMTHVVFRNTTGGDDQESLFPNCTTSEGHGAITLHWKVSHIFLMQTSYFLGSFLTQVPGGMLATRVSSKGVCGICIFISSGLFIALPFAIERHEAFVFLIRILQGIVEGPSVPALNGVISAWAPKLERSRMITIAYAGAYISPAVGLITTGACACYVSWNSIFFIYGGCGVVWSLLWLLFVYDSPKKHPCLGSTESHLFHLDGNHGEDRTPVREPIPWRGILTSMPVYAIIAGAFCRNWIFSMLITQQPQFFKDVFSLPVADIGLLSAVPHVLMMTVVITGGVVVDKLIKHGFFTTTVARKLSESVGFGVEAVCVLAVGFTDTWQKAFILLCVGVALSGFAISGYQVNPLDLAPQYASVLTGLSRLGTLGAVLSTIVASQLTGHSPPDELPQRWKYLFITAAVIHLSGVLFYAIFASGERQSWSGATSTVTVSFPTPASSDYEEASRETERLLRQRLRHRRPHLLDDDSDEYGSTTRFLHTI